MIRQICFAALVAVTLAACQPPAEKTADVVAVEEGPPRAPVVRITPPGGEPDFVGAWATEAAFCALEQDDPDSPMLFTAKGYDQYEAHCDFETVTLLASNVWGVTGRCATAINQNGAFKIRVDGDRLKLFSELGLLTFVRCPKA